MLRGLRELLLVWMPAYLSLYPQHYAWHGASSGVICHLKSVALSACLYLGRNGGQEELSSWIDLNACDP